MSARRAVFGRPWKAGNDQLKVLAQMPIQAKQSPARMRDPRKRGLMRMKFRLFRLLTTVAMLAVLLEALGAGAKW